MRTRVARKTAWWMRGGVLAGLTAMLLPALVPTNALVVCMAADGTLSLEAAHVSGTCAHNVVNHDEHDGHHHELGHHHHHDDGDHDDHDDHEHTTSELDIVVDHEHGCTDRQVDLKLLTITASELSVAAMHTDLARRADAYPRLTTASHATARGPPPRAYFQRTVVMLI